MSVFKQNSTWNPGELYYEYTNALSIDSGEVETVINDFNNQYKGTHSNQLLFTKKLTGVVVLDSNLLKISLIDPVKSSQKGGSGGIGKEDRTGKVLRCQYNKPTNIRHELLHVLGFEHETFHKGYLNIYKILFAPVSELTSSVDKKRREIFRSMPVDKINNGVDRSYHFKRTGSMSSPLPNLNKKNKLPEFGGLQRFYKQSKNRHGASFRHSPNPDFDTVMRYTDIHNSLAAIIKNFNLYLQELKIAGLIQPIEVSRYQVIKINPISGDKPNAFSSSEKNIIKNY